MWNKVKKISERAGTSTTSRRQQEAQVRAWAKERKAKEETQTQATEESKENATGVKKWDTGQASAGRRLLRSKGKTNIHQVEEDDHERHEQNTCYRMFTTCNCHSHFLAISFFVSRFFVVLLARFLVASFSLFLCFSLSFASSPRFLVFLSHSSPRLLLLLLTSPSRFLAVFLPRFPLFLAFFSSSLSLLLSFFFSPFSSRSLSFSLASALSSFSSRPRFSAPLSFLAFSLLPSLTFSFSHLFSASLSRFLCCSLPRFLSHVLLLFPLVLCFSLFISFKLHHDCHLTHSCTVGTSSHKHFFPSSPHAWAHVEQPPGQMKQQATAKASAATGNRIQVRDHVRSSRAGGLGTSWTRISWMRRLSIASTKKRQALVRR